MSTPKIKLGFALYTKTPQKAQNRVEIWKLRTKFLKKYALGTQSQGPNLQKKSLVFCQFSRIHKKISELKGKGPKRSRAENSSARALALASSARAHH